MKYKLLFVFLCFQICNFSQAKKTKRPVNYGSCQQYEFLCENQNCVDRSLFCNGENNCGDNSDEIFCSVYKNSKRPSHFAEFWCVKEYPSIHIPEVWRCDGIIDCPKSKRDELKDCDTFKMLMLDEVEHVAGSLEARQKAAYWILNKRQNNSRTSKWGINVPRIAVALYLADPRYFDGTNTTGNEIAYEIDNQVFAIMLRDKTEPISPNELALHIHALLVTCANPRDFHGVNLVDKLRHQINTEEAYVSPLVISALCNANDTMTASDVEKLVYAFKLKERTCSTSTQALTLMAISCIAKQHNGPHVKSSIIAEMSMQLKLQQRYDGSFENLYTTALVMQALFASGTEDDGGWNMTQAVTFLVKNQNSDGSYGSLLNTYLALPVLHYNSLTSISSTHCPSKTTNENTDVLEKLGFKIGKRIHVKYTLRFGDKVDLAYSMALRIFQNMTFFDMMNVAKTLDKRYDFSYNLHDFKPCVYKLAGYQDDPESEKFWFLYKANDSGYPTNLIKSPPTEVIPQDKEEYVMWYRTRYWVQNQHISLQGSLKNSSSNLNNNVFERGY